MKTKPSEWCAYVIIACIPATVVYAGLGLFGVVVLSVMTAVLPGIIAAELAVCGYYLDGIGL